MCAVQPRLPTRSDLKRHIVEVLRSGDRRHADVYLVELPAGPAVVKDFGPRGRPLRATLGAFAVAREVRAYRALQGHPEVPRLLGQIDRFAFAIEHRPGRHMARSLSERVPAGFADALEAAVRGLHARGVVHLDLKHRSNVLLGEDGRPVLLDFASSLCFRPGGFGARWILPLLAWIDRDAVEKWRVRVEPQSGSGVSTRASSSAGGRGASRPT